MREYKFRGKRLDNGEWVEGCYLVQRLANKHQILEENECLNPYTPSYFDFIEVEPATVGQYTGLKDKNGKEIYEGDILRDTVGSKYFIYYFTPDAKYISVMVYAKKYNENNYDMYTYENEGFGDEVWAEDEVIGNIHDNPELLEG